ncbi:ParB/RepB/Spo0J family partition protein [Sphingomonas sp.]|uniref:ParB/RepB/Spo0J family partition protein n=1 Tax=Sphingomonas sp. TaxID=28214 RepID=UPI003CC6DBF7
MAQHLIDAAPATPADGLHQEALPDFILVRTDEVDEDERLRPVDPVRVQGLAATLRKDGQDTPIQVCRLPGRNRWTLVTGAHRRAAAELAGIEYLRAEVVSQERNSRRLREIRENLFAPDLLPIDRAAFVAELVQIKRAQAGLTEENYRDTQARYGLKRALQYEAAETLDTMSGVYGWSREVAADLGFADRTVRRDLELYRGLPASLVERLRAVRHPILSNASQLRALVKLPPAEREAIVDQLVTAVDGKGKPLTLALARALAGSGSPSADPETKRLSAFIGAFARMSLAERKGALAQLAGMLPSPFRLTEGEPAASAFSSEHVRYREEALAALDSARTLIDGLVEDEVVPGERGVALEHVAAELQLTRFTIAGNGFPLGGAA